MIVSTLDDGVKRLSVKRIQSQVLETDQSIFLKLDFKTFQDENLVLDQRLRPRDMACLESLP